MSSTQRDELSAAFRREVEAATERLASLHARRRSLQQELETVTATEEEIRRGLEALRSVAAHAGHADVVPEATRTLAGGELRQTIGRVALRRNAHGDEVHWRTWFEWLRADGYDAAGKRAEATFQTQLVRSPLVRRSDREGVYVLDVELLLERRDDLLELHERLATIPPPEQLALIGDGREERRSLQQQITRAERALEEAWRTLTEELDLQDEPEDADHVIRIWQERSG